MGNNVSQLPTPPTTTNNTATSTSTATPSSVPALPRPNASFTRQRIAPPPQQQPQQQTPVSAPGLGSTQSTSFIPPPASRATTVRQRNWREANPRYADSGPLSSPDLVASHAPQSYPLFNLNSSDYETYPTAYKMYDARIGQFNPIGRFNESGNFQSDYPMIMYFSPESEGGTRLPEGYNYNTFYDYNVNSPLGLANNSALYARPRNVSYARGLEPTYMPLGADMLNRTYMSGSSNPISTTPLTSDQYEQLARGVGPYESDLTRTISQTPIGIGGGGGNSGKKFDLLNDIRDGRLDISPTTPWSFAGNITPSPQGPGSIVSFPSGSSIRVEPNSMRSGGTVNSAQGLASLGRGNDSMLVHMTPNEVRGLQSLAMAHGGSLTTNPNTGLPEAGFLDKILPTIAGLGLNIFAPGLGALGAGLLTGAATGIATGDMKKGLLGGIGAAGGFGLGQGLASLGGAGAAQAAGTEAATQTAFGAAQTPFAPLANAGARTAAEMGASNLAGQSAAQGAGMLGNAGSQFGNIGAGAKNLFGGNLSGFNPNMGNIVGTGGRGLLTTGAMAAAPFLAMGQNGMGNVPGMGGEDDMKLGRQRLVGDEVLDPNLAGMEQGYEQNWFGPGYGSFQRYASGGLAAFADGGVPGVHQPGGYLNGPGDGMSDSIPATIANKQPARLADGEFVVPADVVSHLGNGSSKAGAKHLYSMMDRIRQARTGTTEQGKQINPNKFMPV